MSDFFFNSVTVADLNFRKKMVIFFSFGIRIDFLTISDICPFLLGIYMKK